MSINPGATQFAVTPAAAPPFGQASCKRYECAFRSGVVCSNKESPGHSSLRCNGHDSAPFSGFHVPEGETSQQEGAAHADIEHTRPLFEIDVIERCRRRETGIADKNIRSRLTGSAPAGTLAYIFADTRAISPESLCIQATGTQTHGDGTYDLPVRNRREEIFFDPYGLGWDAAASARFT